MSSCNDEPAICTHIAPGIKHAAPSLLFHRSLGRNMNTSGRAALDMFALQTRASSSGVVPSVWDAQKEIECMSSATAPKTIRQAATTRLQILSECLMNLKRCREPWLRLGILVQPRQYIAVHIKASVEKSRARSDCFLPCSRYGGSWEMVYSTSWQPLNIRGMPSKSGTSDPSCNGDESVIWVSAQLIRRREPAPQDHVADRYVLGQHLQLMRPKKDETS